MSLEEERQCKEELQVSDFFNFPLFVLSWYSVREVVSWRHALLDRYIFQRIKLYISNLIIFESISNFRFSSW